MSNDHLDDSDATQETYPNAWFDVGELVITKIKNRWGLECAGIIREINNGTADVTVFNMQGPGADTLVTKIPLTELMKDGKEEYYTGWDDCKARVLKIIDQESGEGSLDSINVENLIQRIKDLP